MDVWTSLLEGERYGVWLIGSLFLLIFALVVCPFIYAYRQRKFRLQIANHVITNTYKLPQEITPAELSYIFSSSIKKRHVYASLMQLVNDGILSGVMHNGSYLLRIGPRVDSRMPLASAYVIDQVEQAEQLLPEKLVDGNTSYTVSSTSEKVDGSKLYVFWWLIREGLRERGIIVSRPVKAYLSVVIKNQLKIVGCTILSVFSLQLLLMVIGGDIDLGATRNLLSQAFVGFAVTFPLTFLIAFFLVKIRGRFLGRYWVMTEKKRRLLNQFDAFREYVRLVQEGRAIFESDEAERRARLKTLPYAVALGYAEVPAQYAGKNK